MNTNPDDTTLALWLDDELLGDACVAVNTWAEQHPEQLARREEIRNWRKIMASAMPAVKEPPAAEFFNARIAHAIQAPNASPAKISKTKVDWRSILMPLAACVGMAFTFWLGTRNPSSSPEIDVAGAPKAIPVEPILYTPDNDVKAEWFTSSKASATVIVLHGVDPIPDSVDFSTAASSQNWREIDATAKSESEDDESSSL